MIPRARGGLHTRDINGAAVAAAVVCRAGPVGCAAAILCFVRRVRVVRCAMSQAASSHTVGVGAEITAAAAGIARVNDEIGAEVCDIARRNARYPVVLASAVAGVAPGHM